MSNLEWTKIRIRNPSQDFLPNFPSHRKYSLFVTCCSFSLTHFSHRQEVGKVTLKINSDEALRNECVLKSNSDEALNDDFS
jgi:hypothetical protein